MIELDHKHRIAFSWLAGFILCLFPISSSYISNEKFIREIIVNHHANQIINLRPVYFSDFSPLKIVHIGDSHVQAGFLTLELSKLLSEKFGFSNISVGAVFPFSVLETNNPAGYKSYHTGRWTYEKVNGSKIPIGAGLFGSCIHTSDVNATLAFKVLPLKSLNNRFDRVGIFYTSESTQSFPLIAGCKSIKTDSLNGYIEFALPAEVDSIRIQFSKAEKFEITISGVLLINSKAKIMCSSTGLNGATVSGYLKATQLPNQLRRINPQLVLITLGTNDAYSNVFRNHLFYHDIDSLLTEIKRAIPSSQLVLITPNDHLRKRTYPNPNLIQVKNAMLSMAIKHDIAVWDFHQLMGGEGSINRWVRFGIASADGVHLRPSGYRYQGELLYRAMENSLSFDMQND